MSSVAVPVTLLYQYHCEFLMSNINSQTNVLYGENCIVHIPQCTIIGIHRETVAL